MNANSASKNVVFTMNKFARETGKRQREREEREKNKKKNIKFSH